MYDSNNGKSDSPPPYSDVMEKNFHKIDISPKSEAPQEGPWLKFEFSLDLCAAARLMHTFLKAVDNNGKLYEADCVLNAIRRYETCWIPLKLAQPNQHHIAPVDVQWVWLTHMLCPVTYRSDCLKITGQPVVNRPFAPLTSEEFGKCEEITKALWVEMCPNEPYDFETSMQLNLENLVYKQKSEYDICAAVQRQREFNYQVSLPHFSSPKFLEKSLERYKKYLYLHKMCMGKQFLTPCYDIDLIWHTHQSHPVDYERDMRKILGYLLNHDDTTSDRSPESKLVQGEIATRELWKETFSESFYYPGAMYRGYLSPLTQEPKLFAPVLNWTAFDFITVLDSVKVSDLLLNWEQKKMDIRVTGSQGSKKMKLSGMKLQYCQDGRFESTDKCTIDLSQTKLRGQLDSVIFRVSAYSGKSLFGRKNLRQIEAECPYSTLAPETVADCQKNFSLKVADPTGSPTSGTLELNTSVHSAAIFDLNVNKFERLTLDQNAKLYQFCMSSARNKDAFKLNPTALVANHILTERRTGKQFNCEVIHSATAVMSQILLYDGYNIAVSVQLIGPEALPKLDDIEESDRPWLALAPDQRALVVRNILGDFAIIKGQWVGFKQRILDKDGKLLQAGDSGKLVIYLTYLHKHSTHKRVYTEINKNSATIDLLTANHKLTTKTISVSSAGWVLEQVGLMLSVGLLVNLCNPDRVQSQVIRQDVKIVPCLRWPLVLLTGYGAESPSNKYFEYCRRQGLINNSQTATQRGAQSQDDTLAFAPYYFGYYDPFLFAYMYHSPMGLYAWDGGVNNICVNHQIGSDGTVVDSGFFDGGGSSFDGISADPGGYAMDCGACGSGGPSCGGAVIGGDGCGVDWGAAESAAGGGFCGGDTGAGGSCGGHGGGTCGGGGGCGANCGGGGAGGDGGGAGGCGGGGGGGCGGGCGGGGGGCGGS